MDPSSPLWLSEMELCNIPLMDEFEMNANQESFDIFAANSFASEIYSAKYPSFSAEIPTSVVLQTGIAKSTSKCNNIATPKVSSGSAPKVISFGYGKQECPNDLLEYSEGMMKVSQSCRSPKRAQYHMLKERKRRERMGKQLVDLAALIPNTRKKQMDKPSILNEAMRYIKELKDRVKEVEKGESMRGHKESTISVKRSRISSDDGDDDDMSSSEENSPCHGGILFSPDIQVDVSGRSMLVKIHCHNQDGLIVKLLNEIQKHALSITCSNAAPFANSTLLISIIAQMKDGFKMTAKDLGRELRLAIMSFNY